MRHVLVFGAGGGIGLEAVKIALARGHRVRAMARGAADRIGLEHPRLETRSADTTDPAAGRSALGGTDAVIQAVGVAPGLRRMFAPVSLFSTTTRVMVSVMRTPTGWIPRLDSARGIQVDSAWDSGSREVSTPRAT